MSQQVADRNLLFGMLALQMDFIKRDQLIAAMQAWVFDKSKPLGQILLGQKALAEDNHALIEALVKKHLAMHDNDVEKSLAAVSEATSIKKELEVIRDADVQASLMHVSVGKGRPDDPYATVASSTIKPEGGMRFRIVRPHARGGLGEVFIARDEELHREVALKEIQERQADNPDSRFRFVVEAEITGGLEHPGIVPVYGLGTYADGRPYYAMRFIRGDSLKDAIEKFHKLDKAGMDPGQRTLAIRSLLGRFVDVCDAIAYAHSRNVLHRDLKPGNIMLGKYGETLVVDWGLAKPMGKSGEKTEPITEPGEGSLVPHSISSSSQTLVGAAVGTPQYMSPEQAAGKIDQLGPASDVYSLGATLYCLLTGQAPFSDKDVGSILQKVQRGDYPKPSEIKASVPKSLEAICKKAMALNPNDRYASPRGLADDIEHWLADEPVSAWPDPWTVKARRWIGRHRTLVSGVVASVVVAVVGLTVGIILLTAANERERLAKLEAIEQKQIAEKNFKLARSAVDRYFTQVSENQLLNEPGMHPLRMKLLDAAKEYYDKFAKDRANDKAVQGELGMATFRLAQITGEIDSEVKAIELHEKAAKLFETLAAEQKTTEIEADLAACYHHLGRLNRLIDQTVKSEDYYKDAIKRWDELVKANPKDDRLRAGLARSEMGLGNNYQHTGKRDLAESNYQKAIHNGELLGNEPEYQRDLAVAHNNLGGLYRRLGSKNAAKEFETARAIEQRLVDGAPNVSQYQNDLARTDYNRGDFQAAAKRWRELVKVHPTLTEPHKTLAEAHAALADLYQGNRDFAKAEDECDRALKILRTLADSHKGISSYQGDLAKGLFAMGQAHRVDGKSDKAKAAYDEAISIQAILVHDLPLVPHYQAALARSHFFLGMMHAGQKEQAKAVADYDHAVAVMENLLKNFGAEPEYKDSLCDALLMRADALAMLKRYPDAQKDWDQSSGLNLPRTLLAKAITLARSGKHEEAAKTVEPLQGTKNGDALYRLAGVYSLSVGVVTTDPKAPADLADKYAEQAVKLLGAANENGYFLSSANVTKLQSDSDFQSLRERPAFKKLISELKTK